MCSHHRLHERQGRLLIARDGKFRQRHLETRSLYDHIISGSAQQVLWIADRRGQIELRGWRGVGVVRGKCHRIAWCQISLKERSESFWSSSRSGDQCYTVACVQLYEQFLEPVGHLLGRVEHQERCAGRCSLLSEVQQTG